MKGSYFLSSSISAILSFLFPSVASMSSDETFFSIVLLSISELPICIVGSFSFSAADICSERRSPISIAPIWKIKSPRNNSEFFFISTFLSLKDFDKVFFSKSASTGFKFSIKFVDNCSILSANEIILFLKVSGWSSIIVPALSLASLVTALNMDSVRAVLSTASFFLYYPKLYENFPEPLFVYSENL